MPAEQYNTLKCYNKFQFQIRNRQYKQNLSALRKPIFVIRIAILVFWVTCCGTLVLKYLKITRYNR